MFPEVSPALDIPLSHSLTISFPLHWKLGFFKVLRHQSWSSQRLKSSTVELSGRWQRGLLYNRLVIWRRNDGFGEWWTWQTPTIVLHRLNGWTLLSRKRLSYHSVVDKNINGTTSQKLAWWRINIFRVEVHWKDWHDMTLQWQNRVTSLSSSLSGSNNLTSTCSRSPACWSGTTDGHRQFTGSLHTIADDVKASW